MRIFFHPQRGAVTSAGPINPICGRYRGGQDSGWNELKGVSVEVRADGTHEHQGRLPAGFLWGDERRQFFGLGGPELVFGPLEKKCRECGKAFVFSAQEQRHWYEVLGFFIDATAVRCAACRAARRDLELARRRYEVALRTVSATPTAGNHLEA